MVLNQFSPVRTGMTFKNTKRSQAVDWGGEKDSEVQPGE